MTVPEEYSRMIAKSIEMFREVREQLRDVVCETCHGTGTHVGDDGLWTWCEDCTEETEETS